MTHERIACFVVILAICVLSVSSVMAQRVETRVDSAEVVYVEGNALVLRLTNGQVKQFDVPDSVRFAVEGRSLAPRELSPGMKVSATISTAIAPRWVDAVEVVEVGTVWKISGGNLIVKTPAGENKLYRVPVGGTITLGGKTIGLDQLNEGDRITATVLKTRPGSEVRTSVPQVAQIPATQQVAQMPATPPRVGPLLIDEGVTEEDSTPGWRTTAIYVFVVGLLFLLGVVLLMLRRRRKK